MTHVREGEMKMEKKSFFGSSMKTYYFKLRGQTLVYSKSSSSPIEGNFRRSQLREGVEQVSQRNYAQDDERRDNQFVYNVGISIQKMDQSVRYVYKKLFNGTSLKNI